MRGGIGVFISFLFKFLGFILGVDRGEFFGFGGD